MKPITVIVETPKGSAQKYVYDKKLERFKLKKMLPAGMVFPFDFGFIPGTKGEDGDPLDVIVISEFKSFPGCAMDCNIIGAINAQQTGEDGKMIRNDRFIGIPDISELFGEITSVHHLPASLMQQLESFFRNYISAEGKEFEILGLLDKTAAEKLIK